MLVVAEEDEKEAETGLMGVSRGMIGCDLGIMVVVVFEESDCRSCICIPSANMKFIYFYIYTIFI